MKRLLTVRFSGLIGLSLLILLTTYTSANAQSVDIRGVVTDSVTGKRIPYANVTITGTSRGAYSDVQGFYLIPNVPQGSYQITASEVSYARKVLGIVVRPGRSVEVNFQLAPRVIESEEVVVKGLKKKELTEINTSVHILDQKDMKLTPVTAQEDVMHSIKILPGIVSTSDVSSRFYVRGGAGDQNLVLFDGMRIYSPFHALGIFSIFDPDIVRNVEVYTGAFPPGFGGRLSSVLNILTEDGRGDRPGGRVNMNFLSTKLKLEGPAFEGTSWMFNGRKSLFGQTFKNIVNQDIPVSFYDVFFKVSQQIPGGSKVDAEILSTADDLKMNDPNQPNYFWRNQAIGLTFSGFISDRLLTNVLIYSNSFTGERDAKSSSFLTPSSTVVNESGVRAQSTMYTDRQDLFFFGFEFSFPSLEYSLVNNVGVSRKLTNTTPDVSSWVRYQAKFDDLMLDGGLQFELGSMLTRSEFKESIQPRLNASYLMVGNWRAKVSYGRFSQNVITVSNEDDVISIFDAWIRVPLTLQSEQADHYVVGVEGNLTEAVSTSVQAYYKDYHSLVTYNPDKVDASDPDYINGTGSSQGLELLLRAGLPSIDLYGTYSLGWTRVNNRGLTYYPRYDRRHHINALGVLHLTSELELTLRWEFGSGFPFTQSMGYYDRLGLGGAIPGPFELETGQPYIILGQKDAARLPDYHRLDASVVYNFSVGGLKGSLGAHVINVYNQKNVFYFDRNTGHRIDMLSFFPSATMSLEY